MKTRFKEIYEAPKAHVLTVRMEAGLLQTSSEKPDYDPEEW